MTRVAVAVAALPRMKVHRHLRGVKRLRHLLRGWSSVIRLMYGGVCWSCGMLGGSDDRCGAGAGAGVGAGAGTGWLELVAASIR